MVNNCAIAKQVIEAIAPKIMMPIKEANLCPASSFLPTSIAAKIKIAIKLGILTPDLELTEIATGIAKDGDNINGVSIKEQFDKYYSSVSQ